MRACRQRDAKGSFDSSDADDDYRAAWAALNPDFSTHITAPRIPAYFIAPKPAPPIPSVLYPTIWQFAASRHNMYLRRLVDPNPPWTDDDVLSQYRFTNAFRAADRVSQYLIDLAYNDLKDADLDSLFLSVLLFKDFQPY